MTRKIELGDFQTPIALAKEVVKLADFGCHDISAVLEPTCGQGAFLRACVEQLGSDCEYYGFDINENYIESLQETLGHHSNCCVEVSDFFTKNWREFFGKHPKWLIIGNPPWVTNSALATLGSGNLPTKSNFQQHEGFAAKTGKANFDIAEWMIIKLIEGLGKKPGCLAMLCKTATARKVLRYFWNKGTDICNTSIHKIDAKKYFDVAVDACLFITYVQHGKKSRDAEVYDGLNFNKKTGHIGIIKDELIADIDLYQEYGFLDGTFSYGWRSGIKHDAAKVMELKKNGIGYVNGFGQRCDLEDTYLYPLLKSSDIANQRLDPERYVIVTQRNVGDDTESISRKAPKTWAYLEAYKEKLSARKSMIYKKRSKYSIFGIGDYTFSPWKVVISGMYKNCLFCVVGPKDGKPVMVDDTCYFLPCISEEAANLACELLNSEWCEKFMRSLMFFDAKRPVTIDLLKRINLDVLAETLERPEFDERFFSGTSQDKILQESLLFS